MGVGFCPSQERNLCHAMLEMHKETSHMTRSNFVITKNNFSKSNIMSFCNYVFEAIEIFLVHFGPLTERFLQNRVCLALCPSIILSEPMDYKSSITARLLLHKLLKCFKFLHLRCSISFIFIAP